MAHATSVPVLMHHHVSPSPGMITVSPENFESQIAWLAADGWTSLTLAQYAGFLAGKAFLQYRRAKGARTSPLPDFYIGAYAAIERMALLTRDAKRYRTYYPKLELICP